MMFKNIGALLAWSFQIAQTDNIKNMKFAEHTSVCHSDLSMEERHMLAIDVLAKVDRLDRKDQVCIVAYHTLAPQAIHDAAYLLPNWPRPMQLALVRRWAGVSDKQTQRQIADMCGCSQKMIFTRDSTATTTLNTHYWHGCDMLEIQLLDLLKERQAC